MSITNMDVLKRLYLRLVAKGLVLIITELKCIESAMKTLIEVYRVSDENKN